MNAMTGASRLLALLSILLLADASAVHTQLAQLAYDRRGIDLQSDNFGSHPSDFVALGSRAVFRAGHPLLGATLWTTDGTPEGTELLADLVGNGSLSYLGKTPDRLFFLAESPEGVAQMFGTDGTKNGTVLLTSDGVDGFMPNSAVALGERIAFFARNSDFSVDLWISDGTAVGTSPVFRLPNFASPTSFAVLHDRAYFAAAVSSQWELWSTDGTTAGTRRVRPLGISTSTLVSAPKATATHIFFGARPASTIRSDVWASDGTADGTRIVASNSTSGPFVLGDRAFLTMAETTHGNELWSSQGTPASTRRITALPGTNLDSPTIVNGAIARVGNRVVFLAVFGINAEIWSSDLGSRETFRIAVLEDREECLFGSNRRLVQRSQRIFFESCLGNTKSLWSTDGTTTGTVLLRNDLDRDGFYYRGFFEIPGLDEEVLFHHTVGTADLEIFVSDGTLAGTRRRTAFPDQGFRDPFPTGRSAVQLANGTLVFAAEDEEERGEELWSVGETPSTTRLLVDIDPESASGLPSNIVEHDLGALFVAWNASQQRSLWSLDESAQEAEQRFTLDEAECAVHSLLTRMGQTFLLCGRSGEIGVRVTDGTLAGTVRLFDLPSTSLNGSDRVEAIVFEESILFAATGFHGELWRTDGTISGSSLLHSAEQLGYSFLDQPSSIGGSIYFVVENLEENAVVRSNGTSGGTTVLASGLRRPAGFWEIEEEVLFFSSTFEDRVALWTTNGTLAGTHQAVDLTAMGIAQLIEPRSLALAHDGHLYFLAVRTIDGLGSLWRTDGSTNGTVLLAGELGLPNPSPTSFSPIVPASGDVALRFVSASSTSELWRSDGTPAGTARVAVLSNGRDASAPLRLLPAGGRLFFSAVHPTLGRELWVTDGSSAGTRLVHDIAPGPFSSSPEQLTVAGNRLYFTADDGLHGRELWSLNLDETGCVPSERALCLQDGRFRVEADWKDFQGNEGRGTAVALTPDTGYFWFFQPTNVEAVLKVLDGRGLNDHFWTFYGALSTVEYNLTVTDAETGVSRRYYNPPGNLASRADTASFGPNGASLERYTPPAEEESDLAEIFRHDSLDVLSPRGSCAPASNRLCLRNGRFAVEASWRDFQGNTGTGTAVEITGDTGTFWFFRPENLEVILKVLDGTGLNGKHWVFYGALSSVEYSLTVTDTQTGVIKTYFNPLGRLASLADTGAF